MHQTCKLALGEQPSLQVGAIGAIVFQEQVAVKMEMILWLPQIIDKGEFIQIQFFLRGGWTIYTSE